MSTDTARDDIAKALSDADPCYDVDCCVYDHAEHLADALLDSPALARVIREAKAEAWDEGHLEDCFDDPTRCANRHLAANPYRELFPETVEREEK